MAPENRIRLAASRCGKCGHMVSKLYGGLGGYLKGVCSKCMAGYTVQLMNKFRQVIAPVSKFLVENKVVVEGVSLPMGDDLYAALVKAKAYTEVKDERTSPS